MKQTHKSIVLFIILYLLPINTFANCSKYELESDEVFKIQTIGSDNFLTIYSKYFDMSFFLECNNGTNIYSKIVSNDNISDTDNLLKIKTNSKISDINKINISNSANEGYVNEIKFFMYSSLLSSTLKQDTLIINKNNNKDMLYQLSKNTKRKSSIPLNFQCSPEYFFNKHKVKYLSFENEKLNVEYIKSAISKWKIEKSNNANIKLIEWFINCKKWIGLTQKNNLEDLYSIDKQIVFQYTKMHKKSEDLLRSLQQNAIYNENLQEGKLEDFIDTMNSLKILEKNKSKYSIFHNINDIFYIRNDKDLNAKLSNILSYTQNSYYYDLLSNLNIDYSNTNRSFKLDFNPLKLNIFALDERKHFIVVQIISNIDLTAKNTQFTTYKLSNSICSFLNYRINSINKKLSSKIQIIEYCYDKKIDNNYISFTKKKYSYKKIIQKRYTRTASLKKQKVVTKSKCKNIANGIVCKNMQKKTNIFLYERWAKDSFFG